MFYQDGKSYAVTTHKGHEKLESLLHKSSMGNVKVRAVSGSCKR